ncbi:MAG: FAD/NAD(P)-binding protein [Alphaproteobacteria bacterium]
MGGQTLKVAIIGAGFSGIAAASQLAKEFSIAANAGKTQKKMEITLIDPKSRAGGYAYNRPDVHVPMLNPIKSLGVDAPGDFMHHMNNAPDRWLKITEHTACRNVEYHQITGFNPECFVTNNIFGDYLNDHLDNLISIHKGCESPISINVIYGNDAVDAWVCSNKNFTALADGSVLEIDVTILATGNTEPKPREGLVGQPLYYDYKGLEKNKLNETDSTVIIGAGVGAMFAISSAIENNYRGRFIILCLQKKMPASLGKSFPYQRHIFTIEALEKYIHQYGMIKVEDLIDLFSLELRAALKKGQKWRDVIDSIAPEANKIWRMLDESERRKFIERYEYQWRFARNRMSEYHTGIIRKLFKAGRLAIKAGENSIVPDLQKGGFNITRKTDDPDYPQETFHAEKIVNITGPKVSIEDMTPIMRSLEKRGLIEQHPLGGIRSDDDMPATGSISNERNALYAIGPILKGEFLECTTISAIQEMAPALARIIIKEHVLVP